MSSTIQVILSPNIPIQVSLLQNLPFKIRVKEYPTAIIIPPPPENVYGQNIHATSILYVGSNTSTSNVVITETTFKIGNSSVNTFINSSSISVTTANVSGNLSVSGITTLGGNIVFGTSGLSANGSFGNPNQVLHSNGSATFWGPDDDASAYANSVIYTDNKTAQTYSNAVVYANAQAANAYSNAITYVDNKAANAYSNGVSYTDVKAANAYSNAVTYTDAKAANAYSNAATYADNKAANAYSNAISYTNDKAANAYSNSVSYTDLKASNAYSNATAYADSRAANAYSNAIAFSGNAVQAYTNATTFSSNADNITSGTLNTARLPSTANLSTALNIGANVNANTSTVFIGNSTVNTSISAATITINGVNVNTAITSNAATAYSNAASYADAKAANAYSNAATYADNKAANAYSNAVSYTDAKAANAYSNATTFSSNADNISSGTLNTARLPATANLTTALNVGANVNANTSAVQIGNSTVNTVISAATITINGVNVNTAITSNAATAYSNATAYADNKAANAYSNATAYADSRAATAFSNAATRADNAYTNAVSYTDAKAANAYSNATAYADARAANAYSNAVAYAASNSYVNSTFLPLAGGTLTGNLTINASANVVSNLAANNVKFRGDVQIDGNLTVSGNTVTISTTNLALEDNMIYLNDGSTTSNPDLGFAGNYNDGTYRHAGFFRDATDGTWKVFDGYTPEPDASAFIDTSNNTFRIADFQANVVMASGFTGNGYNITSINASSISVGTLNTARLPATVNVATAFNLGTNVNVNTSVIFVGNSTVNTSISAATITLNGVNVNTAITSNAATAYSNAITYSGNAVQAYTNAITMAANADNITSGTLNTARLPATANLTTALNIGANVNANTSVLQIGNSTVNTSISAATITINGVNVNTAITSNAATAYTNATTFSSNADNITSGTLNTVRLPATVNVATAFNLGANVNANTSALQIGNSTVNTVISAATITINGVNVNTAITSNAATAFSNAAARADNAYSNAVSYADTKAATAYSNAIAYSGNAVQAYTNATTFSSNADNITSGTLNTARLPATANLSTALNVGANVNANTSTIQIGNSTVNTVVSAATITINGVNVNTAITSNAATAYTNAIAIAANADYLSSGTVAFARLPALYLGTTQIQSTSVAQAVTGVTTLAAGNTTITGFANVSSTLQVTGTSILTGNATLSGTLQTISGNANFSSNVLFVDATNGRVGVGISTPGSLLDVAGTLRFASNTTGGNYLEFSRITSNQWKLGSSGVGDVMTIGGNLITFPQDVAITRGGLTISPSLADDLTALNVNHTWNNTSLTFSTIVVNATDTASNASSLLMDLQIGGSSRFNVNKNGTITIPSNGGLTSNGNIFLRCSGGQSFILYGTSATDDLFSFQLAAGIPIFGGRSTASIGWTSSATTGNAALDLSLFRDAAGILAQRNSTNTQTFRVYGTFTDSSNYERVELGTTATSGFVGHYAAGTGSNRNFSVNGAQVILQTGTTNRWIVTGSGHFTAATDNSFDIGASGANRPRNIFVAGYGLFGTYGGSDLGSGGISVSNQIVMIGSNTSRSQRAVIFAGSGGARRGAISSEWLTTDLPVEFSNGSVVFAGFSNTGNFGIGNTAPDAKLVVTGTANVSGNVRIGGITTLAANVVLGTSALSSNGTVGTAGDVLLSNGSATYWGQNNIDGGTPFSVF